VTGGGKMGFGTSTSESEQRETYSHVQQLVQEELKGIFRPEFLNRVDEVVVFQALRRQDVREIAEVEFAKAATRLNDVGFSVTLTEAFKDKVVSEGFFPAYGARPLRRAITRLLEDPLSDHILGLQLNAGQDGSSNSSSNEHATASNTSSGDGSVEEFSDPVRPIEEQHPANEAYHFEESTSAAAADAYQSEDSAAAAAVEDYYSDESTAALSEADGTTENDEVFHFEESTPAAASDTYHSEEVDTESVYVEAVDALDAADASGTDLTDSSQTVKKEESEPAEAVAEHAEVLLDGDILAGKEHHADPELKAIVVDVDVLGQVFVTNS